MNPELELMIKVDGQYYTYDHAQKLRDQLIVAVKAYEEKMELLKAHEVVNGENDA